MPLHDVSNVVPEPYFPGYEFDYVSSTSTLSVTATTAASAQTYITGNAITFDGATRVKAEFFCPLVDGNNFVSIDLWDGSTDLGVLCQENTGSAVAVHAYGVLFLTPSAGSHTFTIKVWRGSTSGDLQTGAGGAGTRVPAWYRVTKA